MLNAPSIRILPWDLPSAIATWDTSEERPCSARSAQPALTTASTGKYSTDVASFTRDSCNPCPINSTTPTDGSSDILECICSPGFQRLDNHTCKICSPGQYKLSNSSQFQACETRPINSYASEYARTSPCNLSDCSCDPGYYGNDHIFPSVCPPLSSNKTSCKCQKGRKLPEH